ncbi:Lipid II flippase FtsW [Candidatus Sulfobium mesophilum]|uniref:Probable peptidoglycan glycosyltransferase FtsW n=1 Tax=Candidatus Sulfobium mesophilum TaxID=2016548 RepID=A0A2U3QJD8_9BACT|nr:Lipid II flippase FtsW [Candidatus Sulfobium mesophilum]
MNHGTHDMEGLVVKSYDKVLLLVMLLLLAFGSLMIYSSTSVITPLLAKRNITEFYYFKRHILTVFLGSLALLFTFSLRPEVLKRFSFALLIFSFVLLCLVFLPHIGVTAGGARRWIRLWPTTFQPSELVKLAMVVFLARYMSSPGYNTEKFASFMKPVLIMAVFQLVFLKQPDFGSTMSLAFLTFAMLFISGMRLRYIASVLILAVPVIYKLAMEPYRLRRITSFLDPWRDPLGNGFQLVQSFISLGSGGLTGLGLGESKQKLSFLPASHTDFIFCLVGEELGLVGALVLISLFIFLFVKGISIAGRSKDRFVSYLAYGLTLMITLQALINFAVVTGLVPTKGLPLPFLSYGGSALLVNMAAIGILLKISKGEEEKNVDENRDLKARRLARRNIYARKGFSN